MATPALTRITEQDAAQDGERLFTPPAAIPAAAYPKRSYAISVLSPAGFPITITLNDMLLDKLEEALSALLERGYMPAEVPSVLSPNAPAPAAALNTRQPDEAPWCPIHTDRRMKVSNYGGWFCTATNGATGEKCTQKVK